MKLEKLLKSLVLVLGLLASIVVFITLYCHLFDETGVIAKKRLLDYPLLTFFITPFFFWSSAYICRKYCPNASGNYLQSAINQLKTEPHNFEKAAQFLNFRLVIIKTISSLLSSFGGGALGKEGPSVHMSAGIFAVFADRYKRFLPKINIETWVASGSAIGLTLAFNTPLSGISFAAEKLFKMGYKNFKQSILIVVIFVILVTIIFHPTGSIFLLHKVKFYEMENWWPLIVIIAICALLASILKSACNYFYLKIRNIKSNSWHLIPIGFGLIVAATNFYSGIYSFSGGIHTIEQIFGNNIFLSYKEVGGRIINTFLTFSSGSAGGLIAPALAIGASIGSVANSLILSADMGIFLLVGMVAFLSVMLGEPITAAIIVFETTGQNIEALPFLFIITIISFALWKMLEGIIQKPKTKVLVEKSL
ncbi:MAG: chloride channel protein [Pseudomonadota bacterium]